MPLINPGDRVLIAAVKGADAAPGKTALRYATVSAEVDENTFELFFADGTREFCPRAHPGLKKAGFLTRHLSLKRFPLVTI